MFFTLVRAVINCQTDFGDIAAKDFACVAGGLVRRREIRCSGAMLDEFTGKPPLPSNFSPLPSLFFWTRSTWCQKSKLPHRIFRLLARPRASYAGYQRLHRVPYPRRDDQKRSWLTNIPNVLWLICMDQRCQRLDRLKYKQMHVNK